MIFRVAAQCGFLVERDNFKIIFFWADGRLNDTLLNLGVQHNCLFD